MDHSLYIWEDGRGPIVVVHGIGSYPGGKKKIQNVWSVCHLKKVNIQRLKSSFTCTLLRLVTRLGPALQVLGRDLDPTLKTDVCVCVPMFGVYIYRAGGTRRRAAERSRSRWCWCVQACIMSVGMRVPYMSLWERVTWQKFIVSVLSKDTGAPVLPGHCQSHCPTASVDKFILTTLLIG